MACRRKHILGNDSTEPSTSHRDIRLRPLAYPRDLSPNVLPLSVAIRPYHECLGTSGLGLEVLSDGLRVGLDLAFDGRVKQFEGITRSPLGVHRIEVILHDMTHYRRDGEMRVRLGIVEVIVLDVLIPAIPLHTGELGRRVAQLL